MAAPDMASIYDFETAIESAVKTKLAAAGLTVYAGEDSAALRKDRPRCEIMFSTGAIQGHVQKVSGYIRDDIFTGQLAVSCVTAHGEGESTHRTYRATVRNQLALLPKDMADDTTTLPYHQILRIDHQSATPTHSPEDGYLVSSLIYAVEFAIRTDQWPT